MPCTSQAGYLSPCSVYLVSFECANLLIGIESRCADDGTMTLALVRSSGWPVSKVYSVRADAATSPFFRACRCSASWCLRVQPVCTMYTLGIRYKVWSTQPPSVGLVVLGLCEVYQHVVESAHWTKRPPWCQAVWGSVSLPQRDHGCRAGLQCSGPSDIHFLSV